jgi:hypothetical protein
MGCRCPRARRLKTASVNIIDQRDLIGVTKSQLMIIEMNYLRTAYREADVIASVPMGVVISAARFWCSRFLNARSHFARAAGLG